MIARLRPRFPWRETLLVCAVATLIERPVCAADRPAYVLDSPTPPTHEVVRSPDEAFAPPATADFTSNDDTSAARRWNERLNIAPASASGHSSAPQGFVGRIWGGSSYFNLPSDSRVGAAYGADGQIPLSNSLGAYGGVSLNHFSGGSQYLGTLGIYRQADTQSFSAWDRISAVLLFDQYTDTRISDLYLSQLRLSVGYAIAPQLGAGVIYTEPLADDNEDLFFNPGVTSQVRAARSVGGFVSTQVRDVMMTALMKFREPESLGLGGRLRVPLTDRVTAFTSVSYDSEGFWGGGVGIEFWFGNRSGRSRGLFNAARGRSSDSYVARGQSAVPAMMPIWNDPAFGDAFNVNGIDPLPTMYEPGDVIPIGDITEGELHSSSDPTGPADDPAPLEIQEITEAMLHSPSEADEPELVEIQEITEGVLHSPSTASGEVLGTAPDSAFLSE